MEVLFLGHKTFLFIEFSINYFCFKFEPLTLKGILMIYLILYFSRLVEICKHPVTTLTHEQMVDLLKTSMMVTVTVIPPHPDGSPRQGCNLTNCSYAFGGFEGDYENVNGEGEKTSLKPGSMQVQIFLL